MNKRFGVSAQGGSASGIIVAGLLAWIGLMGISIAGWVTHVVTCIQTESWILLIAGAILVPVGVIHGIGIWFGVF